MKFNSKKEYDEYLASKSVSLAKTKAEFAKLGKEELVDITNGLWFISSLLCSGMPEIVAVAMIVECKEYAYVSDAYKALCKIREIRDNMEADRKKESRDKTERN